jgi:hypothetical protein
VIQKPNGERAFDDGLPAFTAPHLHPVKNDPEFLVAHRRAGLDHRFAVADTVYVALKADEDPDRLPLGTEKPCTTESSMRFWKNVSSPAGIASTPEA